MPSQEQGLEAVETVAISWDDFRAQLRRNYLQESTAMNNSDHVLRLYPPFEGEMEAKPHTSPAAGRYPPEMSEKPLHLRPEMVLERDGDISASRAMARWPTERSVEEALDGVKDDFDIEEELSVARELFWEELKRHRPETITLSRAPQMDGHEAAVEWVDDE